MGELVLGVAGRTLDSELDEVVLAQQIGTTIYAMKKYWSGPGARTAVVLGAGSAGLSFTALCARAGFEQIIVSDLRQHRLDAARALGATHTVLLPDDITDLVNDLTGGLGAELVVEAAGRDTCRLQAIDCLAVGGTIGLFEMFEAELLPIRFEKLFRKRLIVAIEWGAQGEPELASFREALDLLLTGELDASAFGLKTFTLEQLGAAIHAVHDGDPGFVKAAVSFG